MAPCAPCQDDTHTYAFSQNKKNFGDAVNSCRSKGGSLAKYLDKDVYLKLIICCRNEVQHWIGLVDTLSCRNISRGRFTWIGDNKCTSPSPLKILPNVVNQECQAVSVALNKEKPERLRALELACSNPQQYICQYPKLMTTALSINDSTAASATTQSISSTDGNNGVTSLVFSSNFFYGTDAFSESSKAALFIMIGVIAFLMCLLAGLTLSSCYKKRYAQNSKRKTKSVNKKIDEEDQEAPIEDSNMHCK